MHKTDALLHIAEIQIEEKKVQKAVKEAAKRGDMGSAKVTRSGKR